MIRAQALPLCRHWQLWAGTLHHLQNLQKGWSLRALHNQAAARCKNAPQEWLACSAECSRYPHGLPFPGATAQHGLAACSIPSTGTLYHELCPPKSHKPLLMPASYPEPFLATQAPTSLAITTVIYCTPVFCFSLSSCR